MQLVVARVGRAHGIRGEVSIEVRTDAPEERFVPGATFTTEPVGSGPLTIRTVRDHNGTLLLTFEGVTDRSHAEGLRNVRLVVDAEAEAETGEEDAWYDHELVGLRAVTADGAELGTVVAVDHLPAQDLLVVRRSGAPDVLVPFVAAIVPEVDVAGGRVVLDPPGGLFEELPEDETDEDA